MKVLDLRKNEDIIVGRIIKAENNHSSWNRGVMVTLDTGYMIVFDEGELEVLAFTEDEST